MAPTDAPPDPTGAERRGDEQDVVEGAAAGAERRGDEQDVVEGAATGTQGEQDSAYVSFRLGAHRFAIDAARCVRVVVAARPTPFPLLVRGIRGMINVKGRVATVVDPAILSELRAASAPEAEPARGAAGAGATGGPAGMPRPSLLDRIRTTHRDDHTNIADEAQAATPSTSPDAATIGSQAYEPASGALEGRYVVVVEDAGALIGVLADEVERVLRWPHVTSRPLTEEDSRDVPSGFDGIVTARLIVRERTDVPRDEVASATRRNLAALMSAVEETFRDEVPVTPATATGGSGPSVSRDVDPSSASPRPVSDDETVTWLLDVSRFTEAIGRATKLAAGLEGGTR